MVSANVLLDLKVTDITAVALLGDPRYTTVADVLTHSVGLQINRKKESSAIRTFGYLRNVSGHPNRELTAQPILP